MESKFEIFANIVNGPGKWDFALCLFEKGKLVNFTIQWNSSIKTKFRIELQSVALEDGSRESFCITGGIVGTSNHSSDEEKLTEPEKISYRKFEGYYNTRTRKGWLKY